MNSSVGSSLTSSPRAAVIGAGIAGLTCARTLADQDVAVTVFEKSAGVGGRMSTRRVGDDRVFDHGAQYFTVRSASFARHVRSWEQAGVADRWKGVIVVLHSGRVEANKSETVRYVGVPAMTAVCKLLAESIDIRLRREVMSLHFDGKTWWPLDADGHPLGQFDAVVVSAPSPQAAQLLQAVPEVAGVAARVRMQPCWSVMVCFRSPIPSAFDGAFVHDSALSWVARNSSKPGRPRGRDCWILHGSPAWSEEHFQSSPEEVSGLLLDEFWRVTEMSASPHVSLESHRWRYAAPQEPLERRCLFDREWRLGACGDWCHGARVEGAFLSGLAIAGEVLRATRSRTSQT